MSFTDEKIHSSSANEHMLKRNQNISFSLKEINMPNSEEFIIDFPLQMKNKYEKVKKNNMPLQMSNKTSDPENNMNINEKNCKKWKFMLF